MKQIEINSWREIVLDDLEHIVLNEFPSNDFVGHNVSSFITPNELLDYKFKRKYNLIYQIDTMEEGLDLKFNKQSTTILKEVFIKNSDRFFLIIDNGVFDHFTLSSLDNCEIWPRKYFSTAKYKKNHEGAADSAVVQEERNHWFCSVLGRNDIFRSMMFDWIIDNGLEKENKISYLAYGPKNLRDIGNSEENHESQDISSKHRHLIPFNNFETKDEIPVNNIGRLRKVMPLYDCLFNIVMETDAVQSYPYLTEKTGNTILYGHIPIIIGGSGSMKKLQDMGMIVPDYIKWPMWDDLPIDQSNYSKTDVMQRQLTKFFQQHKINDIAQDWYPYAIRNLNKFKKIESACAEEEKEICRWILVATQNLSNKKYQYLYA